MQAQSFSFVANDTGFFVETIELLSQFVEIIANMVWHQLGHGFVEHLAVLTDFSDKLALVCVEFANLYGRFDARFCQYGAGSGVGVL